MDTDSFIIHIRTDDFFQDISKDLDKWFDTSKYDKNDNRPLEIGKNKKVRGKFQDELDGKIMAQFVALRAKTYEYTQLNNEDQLEDHKKAKGTKKCVIKKHLNFDLHKKHYLIMKKQDAPNKDLKVIIISFIHNLYTKMH